MNKIPITIAKQAVESFVKEHLIIRPPLETPEELKRRSGVFVSLKISGELRGCIGTIAPVTGSIPEEIIRNAISAATEDPRFYPVKADELSHLVYNVDILGPETPVAGVGELDPKRYGVIVRSGNLTGLLLPDLEGVDTVEAQLGIACQKANIKPGSDIQVFRFEVTRYKEVDE